MPSGTGLKSFDFADSTSLSRSWPASFTSSRDASSVIQPFTWMRGSLSAGSFDLLAAPRGLHDLER